jgi:hypothetical protein
MPGDDLRDVGWQTVHYRVSNEDPSKVVGLEQKWVADSVGEASRGKCVVEQFTYERRGDPSTLASDASLE